MDLHTRWHSVDIIQMSLQFEGGSLALASSVTMPSHYGKDAGKVLWPFGYSSPQAGWTPVVSVSCVSLLASVRGGVWVERLQSDLVYLVLQSQSLRNDLQCC